MKCVTKSVIIFTVLLLSTNTQINWMCNADPDKESTNPTNLSTSTTDDDGGGTNIAVSKSTTPDNDQIILPNATAPTTTTRHTKTTTNATTTPPQTTASTTTTTNTPSPTTASTTTPTTTSPQSTESTITTTNTPPPTTASTTATTNTPPPTTVSTTTTTTTSPQTTESTTTTTNTPPSTTDSTTATTNTPPPTTASTTATTNTTPPTTASTTATTNTPPRATASTTATTNTPSPTTASTTTPTNTTPPTTASTTATTNTPPPTTASTTATTNTPPPTTASTTTTTNTPPRATASTTTTTNTLPPTTASTTATTNTPPPTTASITTTNTPPPTTASTTTTTNTPPRTTASTTTTTNTPPPTTALITTTTTTSPQTTVSTTAITATPAPTTVAITNTPTTTITQPTRTTAPTTATTTTTTTPPPTTALKTATITTITTTPSPTSTNVPAIATTTTHATTTATTITTALTTNTTTTATTPSPIKTTALTTATKTTITTPTITTTVPTNTTTTTTTTPPPPTTTTAPSTATTTTTTPPPTTTTTAPVTATTTTTTPPTTSTTASTNTTSITTTTTTPPTSTTLLTTTTSATTTPTPTTTTIATPTTTAPHPSLGHACQTNRETTQIDPCKTINPGASCVHNICDCDCKWYRNGNECAQYSVSGLIKPSISANSTKSLTVTWGDVSLPNDTNHYFNVITEEVTDTSEIHGHPGNVPDTDGHPGASKEGPEIDKDDLEIDTGHFGLNGEKTKSPVERGNVNQRAENKENTIDSDVLKRYKRSYSHSPGNNPRSTNKEHSARRQSVATKSSMSIERREAEVNQIINSTRLVHATYLEIPKLNPGTLYKIHVSLVIPCEAGGDKISTWKYPSVVGRTEPAVPGECIKPEQSDDANIKIILRATPAGKFDHCNATVIRLDEDNNEGERFSTPNFDCKTLDLKQISLGVNYEIRIQTVSGKLNSKIRTCKINLPAKAPSQVQHLNTSVQDDKTYLLTWTAPTHPNGYIQAYEVVITQRNEDGQFTCWKHFILTDSSNGETEKNIGDKSYIKEIPGGCESVTRQPALKSANSDSFELLLNGLTPDTSYTVSITAINQVGGGETSTMHFVSSSFFPSKPLTISGTVKSCFDVFLAWGNPILYPGRTDYVIGVNTDSSDLSHPERTINVIGYDNTTFLVTSLSPSTTYVFTIKATTFSGTSDETTSEAIRTWNKTSDIVKNLSVNDQTANSLTIQWKPPKHINGLGVLKAYAVFVRSLAPATQSCVRAISVAAPEDGIQMKTQDDFCQDPDRIEKSEVHVESDPVTLVVNDLEPYVKYAILVIAYNSFGPGIPFRIQDTTAVGTPYPPTGIDCEYPKHGVLKAVWGPPDKSTGPVFYDVEVRESMNPHDTSRGTRVFYHEKNKIHTFVELPQVKPSWVYIVTITPSTKAGSGHAATKTDCQTPSSAPGRVKTFYALPVQNNVSLVTVTWECPLQENRHGYLEQFLIDIQPQESYRKDILITKLKPRSIFVNVNDQSECKRPYNKQIEVVPQVLYTFEIRAKVVKVDESGEPRFYNYTTLSSRPPPIISGVSHPQGGIKSKITTPTKSTFSVQIFASSLLDNSNGEITSAGVVVCPDADCVGALTQRKTWSKARQADFNIPFICTKELADKLRGSKTSEISYTVGNDNSCNKRSSSEYCNGPLPSDKKLWVKVFSCTKAGCRYSNSTGPFKTAASTESSNAGAIAGAISGVLVAILFIAAGFGIHWWFRRHRRPPMNKPKSYVGAAENGSAPALELTEVMKAADEVTLVTAKRPITISRYEQNLNKLQQCQSVMLDREFKELTGMSPEHEMEEGKSPENKPSNRWVNIIPFDHSRVKLSIDETQEIEKQRDYINANFIPGVNSPKRYIATQGPLQGTIGDFWRMVWEQGVYVIVMLSQFEEMDKRSGMMKEKVARYFPDQEESQGNQYDDLMVSRTGKVDNAVWEIRTLKLLNVKTRKYRFVKHFLFKSWTDHDADISPDNLLEFVHLVRQESSTSSRPGAPLVVHCSAGVGRTGTFLVVDYLNEYLEGLSLDATTESDFLHGTVDIFGTVLHMRNYRKTLVQTKVQYEFIYIAVQELIRQKMKCFHTEDDHVYNNHDAEEDEDEDDSTAVYANTMFFPKQNGSKIQNSTAAVVSNGVTPPKVELKEGIIESNRL